MNFTCANCGYTKALGDTRGNTWCGSCAEVHPQRPEDVAALEAEIVARQQAAEPKQRQARLMA